MRALPEVTVGAPRVIVPGPAVPPSVVTDRANNNLDVIEHGGRRYLAWRTAPIHFAHRDARLHVVSSGDRGATWQHETTVALGRDIREPRFLSLGSCLFLYCFTLGRTWYRFEPDRVHALVRDERGWSQPRAISEPGIVEWRPRWLDGRPTMCVYRGAETTYSANPEPTGVEVWTTDDGWSWGPIDSTHATSHVGGTETDLVEAPGGGWVGVTRLEGPGRWGTDVVRSPGGRADDWATRHFAHKLDSPYAFRCGDHVLVLARRQLFAHGRYDLGWTWPEPSARTLAYHAIYWATRKRSALWHVDPDTLELTWVADIPGRGDTCFPALVDHGDGRFTVYNYTSPLGSLDRPWIVGQLAPTQIIEHDLRIRVARAGART
jgi:hypothetical protein